MTRYHLPSQHSDASNLLPVRLLLAVQQRGSRWNPNTLFTILGLAESDFRSVATWRLTDLQHDPCGRSTELASVTAASPLAVMAVIQTSVIPPPADAGRAGSTSAAAPQSAAPTRTSMFAHVYTQTNPVSSEARI